MTLAIPTIDISPFRKDPSSAEAQKVIEGVRAACTTYGFFQIVGHGVSRQAQEDVLRGAASFFELPLETKQTVDRSQPGSCGRGYELMHSQEQTRGEGGDFKEGYYIGLVDVPKDDDMTKAHPHFVGPNRWLPPSIQPFSVFREPVDRYLAELRPVVDVMFAIVAAGMPYGPHVFDHFLTGTPIALLSPKHYPPVNSGPGLGSGAHTDFGALTLLLQDEHSGLQVQHGNSWIDVQPNPDAYVVNIGDMLQRWTRGEYKSTVHRVVAPTGDTHRYSLPFFFNGNVDAKLAPLDGEVRNGEKVLTVEEHMLERFMATYLKEDH
ncbi:Clavaminate synthase-like protein [Penicillium lagena]|uniref:Clavaminate synthase-like protein n=1 Tax=Penicillium lagena TaxID=94218 RepID=UPI0025415FBC|nr:Clavaminate synthase-like protein [Penicillium lagena]KAJ5624600.1 Clavaminate synthase-like protein [Penicillium lagena]